MKKNLFAWIALFTALVLGSWACNHSNSPYNPGNNNPPADTPTSTPTPTATGPTDTFTFTPTVTLTVTVTPTRTLTATPTITETPTITLSPTITFTRTITQTPTITSSPTITPTPQTITVSINSNGSFAQGSNYYYTVTGTTSQNNSTTGVLNLTARVGDTLSLPTASIHPLYFDAGSSTCIFSDVNTGASQLYTFTSAGTYYFHCGIHANSCSAGLGMCGSTNCKGLAGVIVVSP